MTLKKRVLLTGGSGKAGKHVAKQLLDKGHRVLNCDLVNHQQEGLDYLHLDVTNAGQVFNALSCHFNRDELRQNKNAIGLDVVVHFAAVPRVLLKPDDETYRINVLGTYNVIEAAVKLGIKKVIFASSETVYGFCFSHDKPMPKSLPITEEDPTRPMDSYAMSKVVNEETAKAFQRRSGIDIYGLRIGNVIEPKESFLFENFSKNPEVRLPNLFNYIDARDLGQVVDLCIQKDGLGYEVFNVANDNNSVDLNNDQIRKRFYPGVPMKFEIGSNECLFSNRKLKDELGFKPENNWES